MQPTQCLAQARHVSAAVEGQNERNTGSPRSKHRQWWYQVMIPLTVDKVPPATSDDAIDAWREVIVLVGRPRAHPADPYALQLLNGREPPAHIRRQDRDLDSRLPQTPSHLLAVRLNTSHGGGGRVSHQH